jgi:Family of unknown function (DUF6496)
MRYAFRPRAFLIHLPRPSDLGELEVRSGVLQLPYSTPRESLSEADFTAKDFRGEEWARPKGGRVKSRKHAIAIGRSKARKKGEKVPAGERLSDLAKSACTQCERHCIPYSKEGQLI